MFSVGQPLVRFSFRCGRDLGLEQEENSGNTKRGCSRAKIVEI